MVDLWRLINGIYLIFGVLALPAMNRLYIAGFSYVMALLSLSIGFAPLAAAKSIGNYQSDQASGQAIDKSLSGSGLYVAANAGSYSSNYSTLQNQIRMVLTQSQLGKMARLAGPELVSIDRGKGEIRLTIYRDKRAGLADLKIDTVLIARLLSGRFSWMQALSCDFYSPSDQSHFYRLVVDRAAVDCFAQRYLDEDAVLKCVTLTKIERNSLTAYRGKTYAEILAMPPLQNGPYRARRKALYEKLACSQFDQRLLKGKFFLIEDQVRSGRSSRQELSEKLEELEAGLGLSVVAGLDEGLEQAGLDYDNGRGLGTLLDSSFDTVGDTGGDIKKLKISGRTDRSLLD